MKLLLLGCGGQVGWELRRSLSPLGQVEALDFNTEGPRSAPELKADFTDPAQVAEIVRRVRPDVIVNAAAHTAVDKAESEPEIARLINASTPGMVAQAAAEIGALLVHYSTDYVFDGAGNEPRTETAPTAPLNVYGMTKLEGEQAIQSSGCRHLIFRTSWVYAARGGNFARTMLKLAAERDALKVIADQHGAPTGADLLADVTAHAIRSVSQPGGDVRLGLYHLVASGETTWHAYASHVIEWARAQGLPVKVAAGAIEAVPTTAYPTPAKRPHNSRLDTRRVQATFGLSLPHWQVGVDRMLTEISGK